MAGFGLGSCGGMGYLHFSPSGWEAVFEDGPARIVESWDFAGEPMVVAGGRLIGARQVPGFIELRQTARVAGFIPAAAGWRMGGMNAEDVSEVEHVAGWVLNADGQAYPLLVGMTGVGMVSDEPKDAEGVERWLYHPLGADLGSAVPAPAGYEGGTPQPAVLP